jgi:hypothetical protein
LDIKSTNNVSLHRIAVAKSLDPGFLFLPLLLVIHLGLPLESGKREKEKYVYLFILYVTSRFP